MERKYLDKIEQENVLWEKKKVKENWTKSKLLESLSLSKEELLRSIKSKKIAALVKSTKESILSRLFELEDVNTVEDLEGLLEELLKIEGFEEFIETVDEENFNEVWKLFNVRTKKDLEELFKMEKICFFIVYVKKSNLEKIFKLEGLTKESLRSLIEEPIVVDVIKNANEENFEMMLDFFDVKTIKELEDIFRISWFLFPMMYAKKENLRKIFKLEDFNIENLDEVSKNKKALDFIKYAKRKKIEELFNNWEVGKLILYVDEKILEKIWDLFEIKTIEDLENFVGERYVFGFIVDNKKEELEKIFKLKNLDKQKFRMLAKKFK